MKWFLFIVPVLLFLIPTPACAVTVRDVSYSTKNAGKVIFSHRDHTGRKGLEKNCRACHDGIFDLKKKQRHTMAEMKKGMSCGACHDGAKAFALSECTRCHQIRDVVFRVKATGPTRFSHKAHLIASSDCGVCHPALFAAGPNKRATMKEMEKGRSCGACHDGAKAFGLDRCVTCHPVREITYQVKETGPTHFRHKSHLESARCGACHPKPYTPNKKNRPVGMSAMEKGASCGACHNAKRAFSVKECTKCHPTRELVFEEKSAGNVPFSHTFHTSLYRCGDCHPSRYALKRATVKVTMAQMEAGKSCGGCHDGSTAFGVKDKCESCHKQ